MSMFRNAGCLAVGLLSSCLASAQGGATIHSAVLIESKANTITVRITQPESVRSVLQTLCSRVAASCEGTESLTNANVAPETFSGDWMHVVSQLLDGTGMNYSVAGGGGAGLALIVSGHAEAMPGANKAPVASAMPSEPITASEPTMAAMPATEEQPSPGAQAQPPTEQMQSSDSFAPMEAVAATSLPSGAEVDSMGVPIMPGANPMTDSITGAPIIRETASYQLMPDGSLGPPVVQESVSTDPSSDPANPRLIYAKPKP